MADISCEKPFQLYDDKELLNIMRFFACSESELEHLLPSHLIDFIKMRRPSLLGDVGELTSGESEEGEAPDDLVE